MTTPPMSSDPTFQTRAELEAWAARTAREAQAHHVMGERTSVLEALAVISRVTLAHPHLFATPTSNIKDNPDV